MENVIWGFAVFILPVIIVGIASRFVTIEIVDDTETDLFPDIEPDLFDEWEKNINF